MNALNLRAGPRRSRPRPPRDFTQDGRDPRGARRNLWKAELQRLLARRFVRVLAILLLAAFGLTIFVTVASSRQPTGDDWANATAQAQSENQVRRQLYTECLAAHEPGAPAVERAKFPDRCVYTEVQPEDFLYDTYVFRSSIKPLIVFLAAYLALFGFLVGATYVGAELSSGGMTNLLLWRPRRMQVLGAKLGVLLGSIGAFSVAFSALYVGTFYGIAQVTGYVGTMDSAFVSDLALLLVRGLALVLIVTACAFGVATLGRHTAASLGLATAYVVVWEGGARLMMELLNAGTPDPWFLSTYIGAWMVGRLELYDRFATCFDYVGPDSFTCSNQYAIYWWHAAIVFLVLLAVLVGGAFALFRRRDLA